MIAANISLAKHLDGKPLQVEDIKTGLTVYFPSGVGGVVECRCISCDEHSAAFKSLNKDWPLRYEITFNQPDFTDDELSQFALAIKAYGSITTVPTDEQRAIVYRAQELGYALARSATQAELTEAGYKRLTDKAG